MTGNPFPGMNPWLEQPGLWSDVHFRLIGALARHLGPLLGPHYYVCIGAQTYITTPFADPPAARYPDAAIVQARSHTLPIPIKRLSEAAALPLAPVYVHVPAPDTIEETYLEIRATGAEQVITVIEVLSPVNKRPGPGREKYECKRLEILSTYTHLVEIDLLRAWPPMPVMDDIDLGDYRLLVRRGEQGSRALLYPFRLREPIPVFTLPLQPGDAEPQVELKPLLDAVYAEGRYELRIDYHQASTPPLYPDDAVWASELIVSHAARS